MTDQLKQSIESYWENFEGSLSELKRNGFCKLPPINKLFDLDHISSSISDEIGSKTFNELSNTHESFLKKIGIFEYCAPFLYKFAQRNLGYTGEENNQYHVARRVIPGNSKEQFRAHFDSHLITIVFPLKIPIHSDSGDHGQLLYFNNLRKMPNNEIMNILGKLYFKKYASKKGIMKLSESREVLTDDFSDYSPLIFLGKTTFHTNRPVCYSANSYRLTLLAHFFDTTPKYGVGSILRKIRNR